MLAAEGGILDQQAFNNPAEFPCGKSSEVPPHHCTGGIQHYGIRKGAGSIAELSHQCQGRSVGDEYGIVDFVRSREFPHFICRIDANAYHFEAVGCPLPLGRDENWHFFAARRAPGCPEVAKEYFAAPIQQPVHAAVQVGVACSEQICRATTGLEGYGTGERPDSSRGDAGRAEQHGITPADRHRAAGLQPRQCRRAPAPARPAWSSRRRAHRADRTPTA